MFSLENDLNEIQEAGELREDNRSKTRILISQTT